MPLRFTEITLSLRGERIFTKPASTELQNHHHFDISREDRVKSTMHFTDGLFQIEFVEKSARFQFGQGNN